MAGVIMPQKVRKGAMESIGEIASIGASVASIKKGFGDDPKAPDTPEAPKKELMGPPEETALNRRIKKLQYGSIG